MHPRHRTTSIPVSARTAVLALALALGLGAAVPAAGAEPRTESERPSWAAPWTQLGELIRGLFAGAAVPNRTAANGETDDGPGMDPNGFGTGGDDGPGMDPNGLVGDGDDGPGMDPNGLSGEGGRGPNPAAGG